MYVDLKLKKIGGSLFARIPAQTAKELHLKENGTLRVGLPSVVAMEAWKKMGGLLPRLKPFKRDRRDWDRKIG